MGYEVRQLLHNEGSIDFTDYVLQILLVAALPTFTNFGTASYAGFDMMMTLWSNSGVEITLGFLLVLLGLLFGWLTNQMYGWDDFDGPESAAVGIGLLLTFGIALIPFVRELVYTNTITSLVTMGILYSMFTVIAIK